MSTSKAILETFKFRMIYGLYITKQQNRETREALHQFRAKDGNSVKNEEHKNT